MARSDAPSQRIDVLDVLRGSALLGMFIVHFHVKTIESGGIDDVVRTLVWRLVESKAHGTFALLFGAGFAIQLRRADERRTSFTAVSVRRLLVLALFGVGAHAFFGYNVLLGYAVWAVPLLAIRKWSTRALLVTAVLSAASVSFYRGAHTWLPCNMAPDCVQAAEEAQRADFVSRYEVLHAAESQDSYVALVRARFEHMAWFYRQPFSVMPSATLTLFITGFLMVRHRIFEEPRAHRRLLAWITVFGVASWLLANWVLETTFGLVRDQWLTFTFVGAALLVAGWFPAVLHHLRPVGAAGRMALTNYLIQIASLDLLFSGYGFNLGTIRSVIGSTVALGCFTAEAVFSMAWLKRFHYGPAEWLWRSLTYGQSQPMRKDVHGVIEGLQPSAGETEKR